MTAELCDCFPTKAVGVNRVLDAVVSALPELPVSVWGVDEQFHSVDEIRRRPLLAAAANWLALANLAARDVPRGEGLLIDIGTTTTDLIPLRAGRAVVQGRTDTERLQTGELVYAGVRRTPVFALATELPFRGEPTGLAAELFASTLDVYLTLGEIPPDPKDLTTADGRPATVAAARDRLARMVGADRDGFTDADALAFARAADDVLLARLESAARQGLSRGGSAAPGGGHRGLGVLRRPEARTKARRHGRGRLEPDRGVGAGRVERGLRACPCRPGQRTVCCGHGQRTMTGPVVIKVGGSLLDWPPISQRLGSYLDSRREDRPVVIIGGGPSTDIVRDLDRIHGLGDARDPTTWPLRSLDLTAHLLAALVRVPSGRRPSGQCLGSTSSGAPAGFRCSTCPSPVYLELEDSKSDDPLELSWDVTTDSIAARVAERLCAVELVLLKSAPVPPGVDRDGAAELGLVDRAFPSVSKAIEHVIYLNFRNSSDAAVRLPRRLDGGDRRGGESVGHAATKLQATGREP